jgi:hypothetical protein|nr:MAG TPA: hypothetical protein [Caudoviricetes sp.]
MLFIQVQRQIKTSVFGFFKIPNKDLLEEKIKTPRRENTGSVMYVYYIFNIK